MNLLRLLFLVAAVWLGWGLVRRWWHGIRTSDASPRSPPRQSLSPFTRMVRCAHCGMHLPQREALQEGDHWYCCRSHRDIDHPIPNRHD